MTCPNPTPVAVEVVEESTLKALRAIRDAAETVCRSWEQDLAEGITSLYKTGTPMAGLYNALGRELPSGLL